MFAKSQEKNAETIYNRVAQYLKPKDGLIHVVMVNSFSKLGNQVFDCDGKYSVEIDTILEHMQRDGYHIVDVKFNSLKDQGVTATREGYNTLIMYR